MQIYINSTFTVVPDSINTVGKLLDFKKVSRQGTGVGINNRLVKAVDWDSTPIKEEDRIMIVSATYGG